MYLEFLILALLTALIAAFCILLMTKIGMREYLINHTRGKIQQLLECDFCLGFWIALMFSMLLAISNNDATYLAIPLVSSPLTRFLV